MAHRLRGTVMGALASAGVLALSVAGTVVGAEPVKVAIVVGPVGELSDTYIEIAEHAAVAAEGVGAVVARAYTPDATPTAVIEAVEGASIVVYLGHGVGVPNPYSPEPDPEKVNGWGLQGENARGDHSDSWQDGTLRYYGEAWLAEHLRPAPGWVMIYSNACYAPGAGEGHDERATLDTAARRVAGYSRAPLVELRASAYFATDFYAGAAELITTMLRHPERSFAEVYASESRYDSSAVSRLVHPHRPGAEVWLQHSAYFGGRVDYWYAFAGDPTLSLAVGAEATQPLPAGVDRRWESLLHGKDPHSY